MKVILLINSLESGGAERVVSNILNVLVNKYECYLILIHNHQFYEIDDRVKIISLDEPKGFSGFIKFLRLPILAYKLSKIIKQYHFEKVVSFLTRSNYINVLSSLFMKHNTIVSERAMPSLQYQYGINGKINRFLIKALYPKSDLCLSNSYGNMIDLKNNFNVVKVDYIHNPFDLDMIDELSKQEIEIVKDRFTFITVGRLDHGKNHKLIIEAILDLDADLYIIGDGELKENLEQYIVDLNLQDKVHLLGKKQNPFAYISKADCFIFSSNHEGFPNVLVEALACRLPIISTDCQSGPREILAPNSNIDFQLKDEIEFSEFGILTPIKNVQKMQKAMQLMMNDNEIRTQYKEKARKRAEDFKLEHILKQYEEIISVG